MDSVQGALGNKQSAEEPLTGVPAPTLLCPVTLLTRGSDLVAQNPPALSISLRKQPRPGSDFRSATCLPTWPSAPDSSIFLRHAGLRTFELAIPLAHPLSLFSLS